MEPYNPYSPPASRESAPRPRPTAGRARGIWLKWVYLAVCAIMFVLNVGTAEITSIVGAVVRPLYYVLFIAWLILICTWIYTAWNAIPRHAPDAIDPVSAFGKLIIPFYNLYWMFHVNGALCDALNRRLARLRLEPMAPKGLSVLGCALQIASNLGRMPGFTGIAPFIAVIGHGIWFNYMLECDRARVILAEHLVDDGRLED